jgi:hypothetical protein
MIEYTLTKQFKRFKSEVSGRGCEFWARDPWASRKAKAWYKLPEFLQPE